MAVSYTQTLSVDMIVTEIETLIDWRNQIVRQCFFPGSQTRAAEPQAVSTILMWCKRGGEAGTIDRKIVERMVLMHDELCRSARQMIDFCAGGKAPTLEVFDAFALQFDGFIAQIRRLHQDVADAGMAVDTVTGLRTASGLRNDLKREQDRFDRKGTPFSIADIEIDKVAEMAQKTDRRGMELVYSSVAAIIAKTIRSFDDAYFLGKGEYLVVLKHVEFMDACAVMDRLRAEISSSPVFLGNDRVAVSVSCGICEALQRESPDIALQNAKTALQAAKGGGGNRVQEFREKSALEQYAKDVHRSA
jgi:diguanylate cyclase